ncbi:hypothetical protein ACQ4LE_000466 [Meloidogyne hapla]|uniref:Uncharacterized protein n=1 Tax=Meloidogyne hapla TaxID=6305 RepID=A0A1I8BID7_MELHA
MANKFVLVPQDIYRGLTTYDTGEPNIDFTKREMEGARRKKDRASVKNILYNQELRRYLTMRNERENRPVKVELVASPKGAIMSQNVAHPSTNIGEDDDDMWMSDDLSYSSYPKQPPNRAYNIVPTPSISTSEQNYEGPSTSTFPLPTQPSTSRGSKKINKVSKKIKKSKKPKKRIKTEGAESEEIITPQNAPLPPSPPISIPAAIPDAIDAPLVSDPNPTREITKRVKSEDSEGIKRWRKGYDAKQEEKLKQKKRKDEYLQRKNKIREQRVPIDQVALAQARREDDIKRRQKLKRKWEGPEPIERVRRVVRRPTGIRRSQRSGRIWMERLISAKRKEADIKRFRPSLW